MKALMVSEEENGDWDGVPGMQIPLSGMQGPDDIRQIFINTPKSQDH